MTAVIAGMGSALPSRPLPTELLLAHAKQFSCRSIRQERVLDEVYRRTTIASRSTVLAVGSYGMLGERILQPPENEHDRGPGTEQRMQCYEAEVSPLAWAASRQALANAGTEPGEITHLVTVSCTGFVAPGFDISLIANLELPRHTLRTHLGFMGCHGAINGMRVAKAYVEADPSARVLLCAAELCSIHFQYGWSNDKLVANSLFSDGAAALVITADSVSEAEVNAGRWSIIASGSYVLPDSEAAMQWRIGNHGFQMHLSSSIPELVERFLPGWLENWLLAYGYRIDDINAWAVHPGGPRILSSVERSLNLHDGALSHSRAVLAECGNMSSPTVLFILQRMHNLSITGPRVILGFGPGLTIEAALLS